MRVAALALLAAGQASAPVFAQDTTVSAVDDAASGSSAAPLISNERQLTFEGLRAGEGYFSADGSRMIFQSERDPENPFYQMYLMDLTTGDVDRVSPGTGKTTCGWIHPSEERVLFASTQDDPEAEAKMAAEIEFRASGQTRRYSWDYDETYDIQEYDLATGEYRNLTNALGYDAEGAYSPDGSQIVFASNRAAYERELTEEEQAQLELDPSYFMDVYVMNADGSNVRRLTDVPGYDGGTFWSPDGQKIIWRRFSEDGARAEVYTMNADGSEQTQITELGAMSWAPIFHPSGDYIIFSTNLLGFDNFELYLVDAAGERDPVRVTQRDGFDGLPMFHPGGDRIAWTSNATSAGVSQLFIGDWNDAAARALLGLDDAGAPAGRAPEDLNAAAVADVITPAMEQTVPEIAIADLRAHLEALASEQMDGRMTGTAGELMATQYVADAFAAIGLAPAGDLDADGEPTYFQEFEFTSGMEIGEDNALTIALGDETLSPETDVDWRPSSISRGGPAEAAPVVFAGFGLSAPGDDENEDYDSYAHLDVRGAWALVWRGVPNDVEPETRAHLNRYSSLNFKTAIARAHGATGVIFAPAPSAPDDAELPDIAFDEGTGGAGLPVVVISRATAEAMLARADGDLADVGARLEAGEMVGGLALEGVEVSAELDLTRRVATGRNVLGRLDLGVPDGAAALDPMPPIVVGAHVDHVGHGEAGNSLARADERYEIHRGADDNASGTSAVIEIAQQLTTDRDAGRFEGARDVIFAAWSGEELGLLGAAHYVDAAAEAAGQEDLDGVVAAYLNLDMVGRLEETLLLQAVGSSSVWEREIERRNAVVGLPIQTTQDAYLPTDSTEFYIARVPTLTAFTGVHTDYHSPRDTPDLINYEGLEQVTRLMSLITRSLAMSEEEPDYIEVANTQGQGRVAGVFLGTIPDYASEGVEGVPISGVVQGGPAEEAGLEGGDVIVGLGGVELANIYDYMNAMNGLAIGEPAEVVVLRDGERLTLELTPTSRD